jgi:replicative DNA helicase
MPRKLTPEEFHDERNLIPNQKLKDIANREEQMLMAILVKNKDYLERAIGIDKITYKHFLSPHHAGFFVIVAGYYDKYKSLITKDAFRTIAESKVKNEDDLGDKLVVFSKYYNQRVNLEDYEKIIDGIRERYATQLMWDASEHGNLLSKIFQSNTGQMEVIDQFINRANLIKAEMVGCENSYNKIVDGHEALDELFDQLEKRRETSVRERGIVVDIKAFDDLFQGFRFGKYGVILGFPNGGKTTTMINFAQNMAKGDYKVCYVTIESDATEITERMLSKESQVPSISMKKGGKDVDGLSDETMNTLLIAKDKLKRETFSNMTFISVSQRTPIVDILAMIDRKRQFGEFDVVFFDYLDVIGHMIKNSDRKDLEIADTSQRIQAWGKENNIQVWSAQSIKNSKIQEFRKKDFMENAEKSHTSVGVEDVGGTQAISRDADYVLSIVPHPDGDRLIVYVTKSRYDAPAGSKFILEWLRDTCTIADMSDYIITNSKLIGFAAELAKEREQGAKNNDGGDHEDHPTEIQEEAHEQVQTSDSLMPS